MIRLIYGSRGSVAAWIPVVVGFYQTIRYAARHSATNAAHGSSQGMKSMRSIRYVARRAVSTARRRPLAASLAAFGAALFAIAGIGSELSGTSSAAATPPSTFRLSDPDSVFDARSPGGRDYGWLVNTKQPRTGFDVGPPSERVLTSVRHRPDDPVVPGGAGPVPAYTPADGTVVPEAVGQAGGPLIDAVVPTSPGGVFIPGGSVIGGGVSGPGGGGTGGGIGGTPGGTDTNILTPVTPSVPEPSTWAMLVLGFFAMGTLLRRWRLTLRHEAC
jgi:hypothetical protein